MTKVEKSSQNDIMSTDFYLYASSDTLSSEEINLDLETCINQAKDFESRFSRFIRANELENFNNSEGVFEVSQDLHSMLVQAKKFHDYTHGLFDISILPILQNEGYNVSKTLGFVGNNSNRKKNNTYINRPTMNKLTLAGESLKVTKPLELKIDLGGIGKGYLVEKLAKVLKLKYKDFCISAGGDMYIGGVDTNKGYNYWAIELENPKDSLKEPVATLLLTNTGVATSGVNKRNWILDGQRKNHIINPKTLKSVENEVMTVTVVHESTSFCDIMAKSLLLMGIANGLAFCRDNFLSAVFIDKQGNNYLSQEMEKYVWQEK